MLNQLYATFEGRFRPGESADAAEACRLLLERSVYGSEIVHLLPIHRLQWLGVASLVTLTELQRAQSQSHCVRLTYLGKDCTGSVITMVLATFGKMKKL